MNDARERNLKVLLGKLPEREKVLKFCKDNNVPCLTSPPRFHFNDTPYVKDCYKNGRIEGEIRSFEELDPFATSSISSSL